jgi:beta-lactamase regulating signal transducer with metallopeptidase domain
MNAALHLLTPDVLRTLGLSLLHFLWQGAAVAVVAAGALAFTKRASVRYSIGIAALVLMVAAPVVTFLIANESMPAAGASVHLAAAAKAHSVNLVSQPAIPEAAAPLLSASLLTLFVELWFVGVLLFSLRTAGGFFLIARLRRRDARPVADEILALCFEMQDRLGISRAVRYCQSLRLDAPAVIGWFRPVVMLPVSALTGLSEPQICAVIAHELAHIRRFDAFFNLFQVAAETLLFYHPAVWWLSKRIRAERENCCDDVALAVCGNPAEYARALAQMEESRVAPSFAMAANRGPLASRVARLLGVTEKGSSLRNAGMAFGVLCIAAALVAGNALFGLVHSASANSKAGQTAQMSEDRAGVIVITAPRPAPQAKPTPKPAPSPAAPQNPPSAPKSPSYIEGLKAEGLENLDADELIAMKVQGVTPEYIHEIRAEGLKPDTDELIAMKVQGITPEYIHQVRAMNLKVDVDTLIGMKVQGITPEYADEMRKLGFKPEGDELIAMKVQGITAEYVHQLNELGIHPDTDSVIGMKVQGIDAAYVKSIRATGINADNDQLIALKVQGVDAEFIKSLQAAGFKPDADDIIAAKVMGVTPEFIEKARSHGLKNLDLEKLIQLKHAGVLE